MKKRLTKQKLNSKQMNSIIFKPIWMILINVMLVFLLRSLEISDILFSNQRMIFILFDNFSIKMKSFYFFFMFCIRTNIANTLHTSLNFFFTFSLLIQFILFYSFNNNFRKIIFEQIPILKKFQKKNSKTKNGVIK